MNLKWQPNSFQEVIRVINSPGQAKAAIALAVGHLGSLDCPAPSWDPHGTYRVGLRQGQPQIQRFDASTGTWTQAALSPENGGLLVVQPGQVVKVRLADGSVTTAKIKNINEAVFPGSVTVITDDGKEHEIPIHIGRP